jgi:hypothetical protein
VPNCGSAPRSVNFLVTSGERMVLSTASCSLPTRDAGAPAGRKMP